MSKTYVFEGKTYVVPDDATMDEIESVISGNTSKAPVATAATTSSFLKSAPGRFISNAAQAVNPLNLIQAARHPVDTARAMLPAVGHPLQTIQDIINAPSTSESAGRALSSIVPLFGPMARGAAEQMGSGDIAGSLGTLVGGLAGPKAVKYLGDAAKIRLRPRLNPVQAQAVSAADQAGMPVDLATRLGTRASKFAKATVDSLPIVGGRGADFDRALDLSLTQTINRFAGVSKIKAGEATSGALKATVDNLQSQANQAYEAIRSSKPTQVQVGTQEVPDIRGVTTYGTKTVPVMKSLVAPTDVKVPKAYAAKLVAEIEKEIPLVQRDASPGLTALKQIANMDDFVDVSTADSALSELKGIARDFKSSNFRDIPALRTRSQGIAASLIKPMSQAVDDAANAAGVKGLLDHGRDLVRTKWKVADALDDLSQEPVRLVESLTTSGDRSINSLKTIQQYTPVAVPAIGRSVIEGILTEATKEGGFKADRALATWTKLGKETKSALFGMKDAQEIGDILQFAKMAKENVNPSGTMKMATTTGGMLALGTHPVSTVIGYVGADALARAIYSPRSRTLVSGGIRLAAVGNMAAATILINQAVRVSDPSWNQGGAPRQ